LVVFVTKIRYTHTVRKSVLYAPIPKAEMCPEAETRPKAMCPKAEMCPPKARCARKQSDGVPVLITRVFDSDERQQPRPVYLIQYQCI